MQPFDDCVWCECERPRTRTPLIVANNVFFTMLPSQGQCVVGIRWQSALVFVINNGLINLLTQTVGAVRENQRRVCWE